MSKESQIFRKLAEQKQFRVEVFIDVNAADEEDAQGQVEEMIVAIPNSYIGEVTDMSELKGSLGEGTSISEHSGLGEGA
jgi:hypothetical protein